MQIHFRTFDWPSRFERGRPCKAENGSCQVLRCAIAWARGSRAGMNGLGLCQRQIANVRAVDLDALKFEPS